MRLLRHVVVIGLCLAIAAPAGHAAPADQTRISAPAAEDVMPPDEVDDSNAGATPAADQDVAVTGPFFIRTGTPDHPCLNAKGGGTANHTPIILYDCYNVLHNKWYLDRPAGANYYYIRTAGRDHRCLNAKGGGIDNYTPIILYNCVASWNNVWYLVRPAGANYYYIRTGGAGHRCLNVQGGGTANLTPIILYDCVASRNNVWYLQPAT